MLSHSLTSQRWSAPAHGRIQALAEHNERIFASGALGAGVSLLISGHELVAPANGVIEPMLSGLYWKLIHSDGSQVILAFCSPLHFKLQDDLGIYPKFGKAIEVFAGDVIADIQLPKLKRSIGHQQIACMWPDRATGELHWQRHSVRANETPFVTLIEPHTTD